MRNSIIIPMNMRLIVAALLLVALFLQDFHPNAILSFFALTHFSSEIYHEHYDNTRRFSYSWWIQRTGFFCFLILFIEGIS